jgi:hypothetical protein
MLRCSDLASPRKLLQCKNTYTLRMRHLTHWTINELRVLIRVGT